MDNAPIFRPMRSVEVAIEPTERLVTLLPGKLVNGRVIAPQGWTLDIAQARDLAHQLNSAADELTLLPPIRPS